MKRFTIIISFIMLTFMPLMAQVKQTVAVLGDSYSTFEGFIPKGYATWYSPIVSALPWPSCFPISASIIQM